MGNPLYPGRGHVLTRQGGLGRRLAGGLGCSVHAHANARFGWDDGEGDHEVAIRAPGPQLPCSDAACQVGRAGTRGGGHRAARRNPGATARQRSSGSGLSFGTSTAEMNLSTPRPSPTQGRTQARRPEEPEAFHSRASPDGARASPTATPVRGCPNACFKGRWPGGDNSGQARAPRTSATVRAVPPPVPQRRAPDTDGVGVHPPDVVAALAALVALVALVARPAGAPHHRRRVAAGVHQHGTRDSQRRARAQATRRCVGCPPPRRRGREITPRHSSDRS